VAAAVMVAVAAVVIAVAAVVMAVAAVVMAVVAAEAAITAQDWEDEALRPVRMADPSAPLRPITATLTQARARTHCTLQNRSPANTLHSTIRRPWLTRIAITIIRTAIDANPSTLAHTLKTHTFTPASVSKIPLISLVRGTTASARPRRTRATGPIAARKSFEHDLCRA
jgi:hypothetical protein